MNELIKNSYLYQYNEAIKRGWVEIDGERVRLVVGSKIKKVMSKLMGYFEDERLYFDPTECYKRFKFQEKLCLQGKKPYYNVPIKLMLWQKAIMEAVYSFKLRETGRRAINRCLIEVGRKNGKSTWMAGDINTDVFIGEGGVRICCASNEDKTAKFIWDEVKGMRTRLDLKNELTSYNRTEIRNDKKDIAVVRMSGRSVNDGDNFYKVYQDEGWDCKTEELPEACERSASTNDDYLYFIVSTNGPLNDLWFDKQLAYAYAWLNDEIDDLNYVAFLYEQDDEAEIDSADRDLWQKANPSLIYGVKKWSFIEKSKKKAEVDKESRLHLLCKDFNIKVSNARAWMEYREYTYEQKPFTLQEFIGAICIGGVDISDRGDLTVATALFMRKGDATKYVVTQPFIPESKLTDKDNGAKYQEWAKTINPVTGMPYVIVVKGNNIDTKAVVDWYQSLRKKYGINPLSIGYDPWNADTFLVWCDRQTGMDFKTTQIYQNIKGMSYPMKTVERDIQRKLINFANNPVMEYCFGNISAVLKSQNGKEYIMAEKIDGKYERKIDCVISMIIAYATLIKNEVTFNQYLR